MTASYALLAEAEADLRSILRHTRSEWGDEQARTYGAKLKQCIERAGLGQGVAKDMAEFYPGLRMVRCEHHFIFFLPRDNAPMLVVAMFHERMDLMMRLADRLQ